MTLDLFPRHSIIENLVAARMKSDFVQEFAIHADFRPRIVERRTVRESPIHRTGFARNTFDQLTDGHTCGNGVRIDDNVGSQSVFGKRHVFFRDNHSHRSLLSRTRGEFVTQIRDTFLPNPNFGNPLAFFAFGYEGAVHKPQLAFFGRFGGIDAGCLDGVVRRETNQDGFVVDGRVFANESERIQPAIIIPGFLAHDGRQRFDVAEPFVNHDIALSGVFLVGFIGGIVGGAEKPAFERALIDEDRVFHVVAGIAHDGDDGVLAVGVFFVVDVFHIARFDKRNLAVVQHHRCLVHPQLMVGVIH